MTRPVIAIATVTGDEAQHLRNLQKSVRRVHKSLPMHSPARRASADLSERLRQLHQRGVPLNTLAEIVGLSHQAVRVRVRNAPPDGVGEDPIVGAPMLSAPTDDVVLVCDAGVHRRVHIYDPPDESTGTLLSMIPAIPMLGDPAMLTAWLESEATVAGAGATATPLRIPPAVYVSRTVVGTVLTPLTDDEED